MFIIALGLVLALSLAPSAWAQNGFPPATAANHQYEPHPPGNGNGNPPNNPPGQGKPPGKPPGKPKPKPRAGVQGDGDGGKRCKRNTVRSGKGKCRPGGGVNPALATGRGDSNGNGLPLATAKGGQLPFTGLDLLMLSSLGALLLAGGFGLRAVARSRSPRS